MKSTKLAALVSVMVVLSACGMESTPESGNATEVDTSEAELSGVRGGVRGGAERGMANGDILSKRRLGIQLFDGTLVTNRPDAQPTRRKVVKEVCEALADRSNPAHEGLSGLLCDARSKARAIANGLTVDNEAPSCAFRDTVCTDDNQQQKSNIDVHIGTCDSCFSKCESWCGGCKRAYCGMIWCTMIC
ncbi:MAG: hypothetical protein HYY84_08685 [Deltaproteobacteria bacterium]|nr:hypothetical protein [Deltaproteobacteria bacterium]